MEIKYIKQFVLCAVLIVLPLRCFAEQTAKQQLLTDRVGLQLSSINFDCKERKARIPGGKEFEERYRDVISKAEAGAIDAGLKQKHFSSQDKRIIAERAAVQYLCQEQIRGVGAVAHQNLQVLLDLMMQRQLAERLVLVSKNADLYRYITATKELSDSQKDAFERVTKNYVENKKDADKQAENEIAIVETNLVKLIDELDKSNAALKNRKGVTCSPIGPYTVCYQ